MKKEHFEILMEEMKGNFQLAFEGLDVVNRRLGRLEDGQDTLKSDVGVLKTDVSVLKTDVGTLKTDVSVLKTDVGVLKIDVRDIKRDMGSIKTIGFNHESRLHGVENKLNDHLGGHS